MSTNDGPRVTESSSERMPPKPTRAAALDAESGQELTDQREEPAGLEAPEHLGKEREEAGTRADSRRHPPYVPGHDEDVPLQDEHPSPGDVPVLPANAAGSDKLTSDEQRETIDDESMYEGRPERDKDNPPSERL